jgi:hypothetical protein
MAGINGDQHYLSLAGISTIGRVQSDVQPLQRTEVQGSIKMCDGLPYGQTERPITHRADMQGLGISKHTNALDGFHGPMY